MGDMRLPPRLRQALFDLQLRFELDMRKGEFFLRSSD